MIRDVIPVGHYAQHHPHSENLDAYVCMKQRSMQDVLEATSVVNISQK